MNTRERIARVERAVLPSSGHLTGLAESIAWFREGQLGPKPRFVSLPNPGLRERMERARANVERYKEEVDEGP